MQNRRALIRLGGEFPPAEWFHSLYQSGDLLIAADRGALLCEVARLPLDVLVGDFDSLPDTAEFSCAQPKEIKRFPAGKDFSDGELALICAKERNCHKAVFISALGGRLDHGLFNVIALLEKADQLSITAEIRSPQTAVFQLAAGQERPLGFPNGSWCSVISLEKYSAVTMNGLLYSGSGITLERSSTRGLSNRIADYGQARISVSSGRVLVVKSAESAEQSEPLEEAAVPQ